ncbi:hypothetical protein [Hymenobacter weizhouensis]|uniref:hypothetical protein n=1 Tax=Hymenobacter sp. YIM 151500-1 TaxID=2987689 RepID=UPI00222734F2|nr:hypothetical protein [Hymenobacter sp. YIM 151500-1]UYZ61376.1 hypothetical protein OIS53_10185 [Hymenobacter sp. YIM 151500-1]
MGLEAALAARRAHLLSVIPYAAVPGLDVQVVFQHFVRQRLLSFGVRAEEKIWEAQGVLFFYEQLLWDSAYFQRPMARVRAVLFDPEQILVTNLVQAIEQFSRHLREAHIQHCYAEVGAVDNSVLTALGCAGWATVETRLHYYHTLHQLPATRAAVRPATLQDVETIRQVAAHNRNPHDRFHADPFFTQAEADAFLGEYAAAAVKGLCSITFVPQHEPVASFLAVGYLPADAHLLGMPLGRVVLTAVGPANRGWHRHLIDETLWHTQERGGQLVLLTTQATNRAVIHNCETTGFKLGSITHIVSWSQVA